MPPGHALYPKGLTRDEIDRYVHAHPEKKGEIYSGYTVVKRRGQDIVGVPYHVEYKQWLETAAKALRDAAALSDDPAFANSCACAPMLCSRTIISPATSPGST